MSLVHLDKIVISVLSTFKTYPSDEVKMNFGVSYDIFGNFGELLEKTLAIFLTYLLKPLFFLSSFMTKSYAFASLMLYAMLFHNCVCSLQNMAFSNFWQKITDETTELHAIKNKFYCRCSLKNDGKLINSIGQVSNKFTYFQIRSGYWEKLLSKFAHFLVLVTLKFRSNVSKHYIVTLLTIITINSIVKLTYIEHFVLKGVIL